MVASRSAMPSYFLGEADSLIKNLLLLVIESITYANSKDSTLIDALDLFLPFTNFFGVDSIGVGCAFALIAANFVVKEEGIRTGKEGVGTRDFFAGAFHFTFLVPRFGADTLTSLTFWRLASISSSPVPLLVLLSLRTVLLSLLLSLRTVLSSDLAA